MALSKSFSEKECSTVYWKIKNFSFCREDIESPEFWFSEEQNCIELKPYSGNGECIFRPINKRKPFNLPMPISFLTCDLSPEESISGCSAHLPKDAIFGSRRSAFLPDDTLTIRFQSPTDSKRENIFIYSHIGVKRRHFQWNVKDFSNCKFNLKKPLEISDRYGNLEMTLKCMGGFNTDEIFYIEICRESGDSCYCLLKMHILGVDGKVANEVSGEFIFDDEYEQTKVFPAFFKKRKFLASKTLLLPNDTLSLQFDFAISLGKLEDSINVFCSEDIIPPPIVSDGPAMLLREENDHVLQLQTDLKSMLEDGSLHDVLLRVGSEVVPANKCILSARSPVFRAMFEKDMKEANENAVAIEGFDLDAVRGLLLYIYTGNPPTYKWENMKNLYCISDMYGVLSLKNKCASFLKTNLSISNVCDALVIADLHRDADLKSVVLTFISDYDSEVFASNQWEEIENNNSSMALQVLREICCKQRYS